MKANSLFSRAIDSEAGVKWIIEIQNNLYFIA